MPRGLELLIAQTILQGFDAQYGRFLEVTSGAQQRFEHADWHAVQQAMKQRIHLYDHHVGLVVEQLRCITDGKSTDEALEAGAEDVVTFDDGAIDVYTAWEEMGAVRDALEAAGLKADAAEVTMIPSTKAPGSRRLLQIQPG
jgi:transcriptional/translational regulatory protein YebC/TACO1